MVSCFDLPQDLVWLIWNLEEHLHAKPKVFALSLYLNKAASQFCLGCPSVARPMRSNSSVSVVVLPMVRHSLDFLRLATYVNENLPASSLR